MRKKILLAALLAVIAPTVWIGAGGNGGGQDNPFGVGKEIAGSWLCTLDLGQQVGDVLVTMNADGGVISSSQLRWAGGWEDTRYNSTGHGCWKRTGPNQYQVLLLLQVQNNDGGLVFYEKVTMEVVVNRNGTALEGTGMFQLFRAGNDPLDPNAPVAYQGEFTETARRIQ